MMDWATRTLTKGITAAAKSAGKDATGSLLSAAATHYAQLKKEHDIYEEALKSILSAPVGHGPGIAQQALRKVQESR